MSTHMSRRDRQRPGPRLDRTTAAAELAEALRRIVPHAPVGEVEAIVGFACAPGNGGAALDPYLPAEHRAELVLRAHIRHAHTGYDQIPTFGSERGWENARRTVGPKTDRIDWAWRTGEPAERRDRDQAAGCSGRRA